MKPFLLVALAVLAVAVSSVHAGIHELTISNDDRAVFQIEPFGFLSGGVVKMTMTDFSVTGDEPYRMGFYLTEVESESASVQKVQLLNAQVTTNCPLQDENTQISLDDPANWKSQTSEVTIQDNGMYTVIFARCMPMDGTVSFKLKLELVNPGPNFLSAGDMPLPSLYLVLCIIFSSLLATWIIHIRRNTTKAMGVHHMMTVLMIFKCLSLLFQSITYFNLKAHGTHDGWNVVLYIVTFVKGVMLFVVVLLVGTGWSLLKPFLSDREKKIFFFVIPLQVLDNIAIIVVGELSPGSQAFGRWTDILHIVDIICCCAILMPIVWSIRHLKQATEADGKAADMVARLKQFRQFYLTVVSYIYFTRIVVYLLSITLSFSLTWIGPLAGELATLGFFVWTGYKWRPTSDNPYLRVKGEDDDDEEAEDEEFGMADDEDGVEMTAK